MTITAEGLVSVVYPETHGVVVVVDATAGDTVLSVRDSSDLVNYPDGQLLLPTGDLIGYDLAASVDGTGSDPDTLTLAAVLPIDLTAEVQLDLVELDLDGDVEPAVTYYATVIFDDTSIDEVVVDPHWVTHSLKVGARNTGRMERVECARSSDVDRWYLARVLRRPPKVRPEYLAPGSVTVPIAFLSTVTLGPDGSIGPMGSPVLTGAATGTIYDQINDLAIEITAGGRFIDGGLI